MLHPAFSAYEPLLPLEALGIMASWLAENGVSINVKWSYVEIMNAHRRFHKQETFNWNVDQQAKMCAIIYLQRSVHYGSEKPLLHVRSPGEAKWGHKRSRCQSRKQKLLKA